MHKFNKIFFTCTTSRMIPVSIHCNIESDVVIKLTKNNILFVLQVFFYILNNVSMLDDPLNLWNCMMQQVFFYISAWQKIILKDKDLLNAHFFLIQQVFSPIHASYTALKTYSTLTSHSLSRSSHSSSLQPTLIPAKKTYSSHLSSLIVGLQRHSK